MHATGLTELVGREEELELLLRRWSRAKTGEGQVVLLSGEAGIGKSRLTAALLERLAAEPHTRLRNFCSPQHTDSVLHPTIGQIERAAGFTQDDTPLAKLDKLDALLAQSSTSAHDAALLADMLSLPNDGRYPSDPSFWQETLPPLRDLAADGRSNAPDGTKANRSGQSRYCGRIVNLTQISRRATPSRTTRAGFQITDCDDVERRNSPTNAFER
jgi:hypothetical protein